ncbi:MAG: penicillin-binding protein activator [Hyphomicrobium sp.]
MISSLCNSGPAPRCGARSTSRSVRPRATPGWAGFKVVSLVLTAALLGAGCSANIGGSSQGPESQPPTAAAPASQSTKTQPTRIAMLLPLAGFGQSAVTAKALKQAGELALFELDNPLVQLVVKDDRGTADGAKAAAEEAVLEGADIVVGPLFSAAVAGAAAVARSGKVPVVGFSNDAAVAGNGVYLLSFLAEPEVERIVAFAAKQGKSRFAALIPADAYGKAIEPVFRDAVSRSGGTVVAIETYPVQANAMVAPAKRLVAAIMDWEGRGQPVDALFVPAGAEAIPHLGPVLAYSGLDTSRVKLIGTGAWDQPNTGREKIFVGGWYPAPDPRGFQDFSARFTRTFGSQPPRIASLAYDAVAMAVRLSSEPQASRFTAASLLRPSGFSGIDGGYRFTAAGIAERPLAVLEVQSFGTRVIEPAGAAGSPAAPVVSAPVPTSGGVGAAPASPRAAEPARPPWPFAAAGATQLAPGS